MSYILDALRKSDQQRKRGAAPRLQTVQATAQIRKQPPLVLYGLFAAILLGAGIAIGWWRPWQPERPASISATISEKPLESSPSQAAAPALPAVAQEAATKSTQEMPVQESKPASQPLSAPAATAAERRAPAPATVETRNRPPEVMTAMPKQGARSVPEKPAGPSPAQSAQNEKLLLITDLPPAIRQELPTMSIAVHAYSSNPKDRLVSINNRMLREGDSVQPGLGLEQITPDGMIFSYKGYRFIRGVR
ncbi:MAG: general secretion pathway protein GspB [Betaproteobacteria bacterium]|nr:general secretion pathway protein GspB [Betaproteobacteria bacterium]